MFLCCRISRLSPWKDVWWILRETNGKDEVDEGHKEVEVSSIDVLEMDKRAFLLERVVVRTECVYFVNPRLIDMLGLHIDDLVDVE